MSSKPCIKKLDEVVVNRIAAGEVIQRPFNALKELIENSLDAKSTKIQITVKDGGLKFLQISDNGTGICKEDLGIVCERFTTSKLSKFEDLNKISTYGFRGEALASISHVAHLTIVTKVTDSQCGYRASYEDGKLKAPPRPCAVERGTQIIVENLFYNVATRRNALKSATEEHNKVSEVVRKYAIHNFKVGFSLKKQGEALSDVNTPENSTAIDNIRLIYGNAIAKELIEIKHVDDALKFQLYGYITNVNFSNKKMDILLFINDRLVSSSAIKLMVEQTYSLYLPKNSYPFVYLSLKLNPENVDVNVHPTKHEVHFLHQEKVIEKIKTALEGTLLGSNTSRMFYTQVKLPTTHMKSVNDGKPEEENERIYPQNTVRTDSLDQKMDKFITAKPIAPNDERTNQKANGSFSESPVQPVEKREIKLKSILQLKTDVQNSIHCGLNELIKNFVIVGFINPSLCLLQNETKLFMCNTENLVNELIYQLMLTDFANFGIIRLSEPISIKKLIECYLDTEISNWTETDGSKSEIAASMCELLKEKSAMLEDYFSIEIDNNGNICTLPLIIEKYIPNIGLLPNFIVRVCSEVDWNLEKPCLEGICREISRFYSKIPISSEGPGKLADWKSVTEHVLLPSVKNNLLPPTQFSQDGTIIEITNLPDLYKVFERC